MLGWEMERVSGLGCLAALTSAWVLENKQHKAKKQQGGNNTRVAHANRSSSAAA